MRKLCGRLHRWIGLVLCAYVVMIGLTGSVLVYRPELYRHFEPKPLAVPQGRRLLSDRELRADARRAFPDEQPDEIWRGRKPNYAVEIDLLNSGKVRQYLFDPYSGRPIRPAIPLGFRITTAVLELHTELLGGATGRLVNGVIAGGFLLLVLTGVLAWRPRKLVPRSAQSGALRRWHMTVGIWAALFALMWGLTAIYFTYPDILNTVIDYFEPLDPTSRVERLGDKISYWFAYLHFGRFGGRVPGCRRGPCDETLKALWALIGLAPAFLAASGGWLWITRKRSKARGRG